MTPLPRIVGRIVRRLATPALAEDLLGDLEERWRRRRSRVVATVDIARVLTGVWWHGRQERGEARGRMFTGTSADVRLAFRLVARRPRFALTAILTLALGIGGSTAMLTATRAVLAPTLPYPDGSRLVHLWASWPGGSGNFSYPDYEAMRVGVPALEAVAAYESWGSISLGAGPRPTQLHPTFASPEYLALLGGRVQTGRLFTDADHTQGAAPVAIVSHRVWRDDFGSDPQISGRAVTLNGAPYTIVGVMAPEYLDLGAVNNPRTDIWLTATAAPPLLSQAPLTEASRIFWGVGRLADGATLAQVRDQIAAVATRMAAERPATHRGYLLNAQPLRDYLHGAFAFPARLLLAGSLFMLLIGCANVANLMLARARERRAEFAVRAAVGAPAIRLLRQTLVESLVLAGLGGAAGFIAAVWATSAAAGWIRINVSAFVTPQVDAVAFGLSALLTLATAVLVGVVPARSSSRVDLRQAIGQTGARGVVGRHRARTTLIVSEIALAVVLLVGAGLLVRSVRELVTEGLGFPTQGLLTLRADLAGDRYREPDRRVQFADALATATRTIPGVEGVTVWGPSMLSRATWVMSTLPEDRPADRPDAFVMGWFHNISPDGLRVLGIRLIEGREFTSFDTRTTPPVAVISEGLARRFWPEGGAVGRRLRRSNPTLPMLTVVGVAADARHRRRYALSEIDDGLVAFGRQPQLDLYLPYAQRASPAMTLVVRASDTGATADAIRDRIATLDPTLAPADMRTVEDRLAEQNTAPAAIAGLLAAYAALAVLLAGVGLYSVLTSAVHERTREMGVRRALGAGGGDVVRLLVRRAAVLVLTGLATGLIGALGASRLVSGLLYGVSPADPMTFALVPVLVGLMAILAILAPLRRVSRIDPLTALRDA